MKRCGRRREEEGGGEERKTREKEYRATKSNRSNRHTEETHIDTSYSTKIILEDEGGDGFNLNPATIAGVVAAEPYLSTNRATLPEHP
jgi:hypothetical protein